MIEVSKTNEKEIEKYSHLPKISIGDNKIIFFENIKEFETYLNSLKNELDNE